MARKRLRPNLIHIYLHDQKDKFNFNNDNLIVLKRNKVRRDK